MRSGAIPEEIRGVATASALRGAVARQSENAWSLEGLAGRFIELSGGGASAALTVTAGLIWEAQRRGEPAAWIGGRHTLFYPPDFAAFGIDLAALPVIHAPDARKAARAADALLRSGGFALLALDLGDAAALPLAMQSRLAGLAMKHHTAVLCLLRQRAERKDGRRATTGSLAAVRGESEKRRIDFDRFECVLQAVKDKRLGPGWTHVEVCRGPDGLC